MTKIEIYTSPSCAFCIRAKMLFDQKGAEYTEYRIDQDTTKRDEMYERSGGGRTTPQIFINDRHIGGFEDLWKLDKKGELDPLLT